MCYFFSIWKRKLIIPNLWGCEISDKMTTKSKPYSVSHSLQILFSLSTLHSQTCWKNCLHVLAPFPSLLLFNLLCSNRDLIFFAPKLNVPFSYPLSRWMAWASDPAIYLWCLPLSICNPFQNPDCFTKEYLINPDSSFHLHVYHHLLPGLLQETVTWSTLLHPPPLYSLCPPWPVCFSFVMGFLCIFGHLVNSYLCQ